MGKGQKCKGKNGLPPDDSSRNGRKEGAGGQWQIPTEGAVPGVLPSGIGTIPGEAVAPTPTTKCHGAVTVMMSQGH